MYTSIVLKMVKSQIDGTMARNASIHFNQPKRAMPILVQTGGSYEKKLLQFLKSSINLTFFFFPHPSGLFFKDSRKQKSASMQNKETLEIC